MKAAEAINLQLKEFSSAYEAGGFGEKNVHAFRLKMKRLKAFTGLLKDGGGHRLKISRKLNALYACTGAIRNLQLQKKRILHFYAEENGMPDGYVQLLTAEEEQWKHRALHLLNTAPLAKELEKLDSHIPGHIKKSVIKNFLRASAAKLWALLLSGEISDEDLHRLRKVLKEILYNWEYAGAHSGQFLPPCWQHKDQVQLFTEILGGFHDLCIALELLDSFSEKTNTKEIAALQEIKKQWEANKGELKQTICTTLTAIKNESRELEERKHPGASGHQTLWLNA